MDNPRADRVRTVRSLGGRSAQSRTGLLLVEGPGAVLELVTWRPECVTDVYVTERVEESQPEIMEQARQATRWVHRVTDEVAHAMSPDCQGVIAVARHDAIVTQMPSVDGLAVILARIQDPGNVGTLIRTADAMGAQCVLTTVGTADVRSPKVIRSTAGSVFHLPIMSGLTFDAAIERARTWGALVLGTSGGHGSVSLLDIDEGDLPLLSRTHAWVFGNEARGLSPDEMRQCDHLVRIPMAGKAESLNVASAAAMCLYASARSRTLTA